MIVIHCFDHFKPIHFRQIYSSRRPIYPKKIRQGGDVRPPAFACLRARPPSAYSLPLLCPHPSGHSPAGCSSFVSQKPMVNTTQMMALTGSKASPMSLHSTAFRTSLPPLLWLDWSGPYDQRDLDGVSVGAPPETTSDVGAYFLALVASSGIAHDTTLLSSPLRQP